jgi:hypothetical protein
MAYNTGIVDWEFTHSGFGGTNKAYRMNTESKISLNESHSPTSPKPSIDVATVVFVVYGIGTNPVYEYFLSDYTTGSGYHYFTLLDATRFRYGWSTNTGGNSTNSIGATYGTWSTTTPYLILIRTSTSLGYSEVRINGSVYYTGNGTTRPAYPSTSTTIMEGNTSSTAELGEFLYYQNTYLDDTETDQLEAYLAGKWGVTLA